MVDVREKLAAFYSDIGRPSIDPELLIRMLIVSYCYGIRSERQLCQAVETQRRHPISVAIDPSRHSILRIVATQNNGRTHSADRKSLL
jgi:transposase